MNILFKQTISATTFKDQ